MQKVFAKIFCFKNCYIDGFEIQTSYSMKYFVLLFFFQAKYSGKLKNLMKADQWIPVQKFIDKHRSKAIWDWELACGKAKCNLDQAFEIIKYEAESDLKTKYRINDEGDTEQEG